MSRTASQPLPASAPKSGIDPAVGKPKESTRDFVEQIVVAIILAVLIRGFDAEAFVIPTGSMAPTLMGRHKEVTCPQCGLVYAINASEEIDQFILDKQLEAARRIEEANRAPERLVAAERARENALRTGDPGRIGMASDLLEKAQNDVKNAPKQLENSRAVIQQAHEVGICVNCRNRVVVDDAPSFKGDRILVMKFPYELPFLPGSAGPRRWDVVVFHFPEKPETNYIKRLVGLPGEELRINHGDIQARPPGSNASFQIQRKPLIHQRAMQMLVYDDNHRPRAIEGKPEWRRWNPSGSWKEEAGGKFLASPTTDSDWAELRYRHLLPDPEQWAALEKNAPLPRGPRPTLITDFYSYNTNTNAVAYYESWLQKSEGWLQSNWVGDLTLSGHVDLETTEPGSMLKLELVEAGIANRCEVDLATGVASLYHGDKKLGEAATALRGTGAHDVEFANVDDRLTLWVDGETPFQEGLPFEAGPATPYAPTASDLDPAGIAIKRAKATVSDLVLKRDIYYTQDPTTTDYKIPGANESFDRDPDIEYSPVIKMFDFLSDPSRFAALKDLSPRDAYVIRPDHFMMMGDNSPRSSDSRAWASKDVNWRESDRSSWEVPRSMLIGKAFFVYWPHGKPFGPDIRLNRDFRVPFRPYFERMKWIR
jgi:signal peptidase I